MNRLRCSLALYALLLLWPAIAEAGLIGSLFGGRRDRAENSGPIWYAQYAQAMREATKQRKMLFIFFHEDNRDAARCAFESTTLNDPKIKQQLSRYVLAKLPKNCTMTVGGKQIRVLEHAAFAEMQGSQGIAIVDLVHPNPEYWGQVVSTFPFSHGKFYRPQALSIILDLPPGTLTQRTMIYAVRIHPESPGSTQGKFHPILASEARQHSNYQANIQVQGHHNWGTRFERINAELADGAVAQEVVAESWPNENLVEACVDCVDSWRQSPGHWGAVRSRHPVFGYDIKRGSNGIWYATGIFGNR